MKKTFGMMRSAPAYRLFSKFIFSALVVAVLPGCMLTYLLKASHHQMRLLKQREPIEKALASPDVPEEQKRKLRLAVEARKFAENKLGFKPTDNYRTYVDLKRPYVTWVVSASPKDRIEAYKWSYPIVGKMPYKGFFSEQEARAEAEDMRKKNFDVYVRGVTAYSTLGWFEDPLLSSMLRGRDHQLVNLIIHESAHATLFFKNQADFNERLATFLGNKGTEAFYREKEGPDSPTNQRVALENEDEKLFSEFISSEINDLNNWYRAHKGSIDETIRQSRLQLIKTNFLQKLKPQLKTDIYNHFENYEINNAFLASLQTYVYDLKDFEQLFEAFHRDFTAFLTYCKSLEKSPEPAKTLKDYLAQQP